MAKFTTQTHERYKASARWAMAYVGIVSTLEVTPKPHRHYSTIDGLSLNVEDTEVDLFNSLYEVRNSLRNLLATYESEITLDDLSLTNIARLKITSKPIVNFYSKRRIGFTAKYFVGLWLGDGTHLFNKYSSFYKTCRELENPYNVIHEFLGLVAPFVFNVGGLFDFIKSEARACGTTVSIPQEVLSIFEEGAKSPHLNCYERSAAISSCLQVEYIKGFFQGLLLDKDLFMDMLSVDREVENWDVFILPFYRALRSAEAAYSEAAAAKSVTPFESSDV